MRSRIPDSVKAQFNRDNMEDELKRLRADLARLRELLGEVGRMADEKKMLADHHTTRCDNFSKRECTCGANDMYEFCEDLVSRIQSELKE